MPGTQERVHHLLSRSNGRRRLKPLRFCLPAKCKGVAKLSCCPWNEWMFWYHVEAGMSFKFLCVACGLVVLPDALSTTPTVLLCCWQVTRLRFPKHPRTGWLQSTTPSIIILASLHTGWVQKPWRGRHRWQWGPLCFVCCNWVWTGAEESNFTSFSEFVTSHVYHQAQCPTLAEMKANGARRNCYWKRKKKSLWASSKEQETEFPLFLLIDILWIPFKS